MGPGKGQAAGAGLGQDRGGGFRGRLGKAVGPGNIGKRHDVVQDEVDLRDRRLLSSCYTSVLNVAHAAGLGSVGLCSLSTGVFGYPKRQAALVTLETIGRWLAAHPDSRMRIVISLNADVDVAAYEAALAPPPWRP